MSDTTVRCPRCDGIMEEGFLLDSTYGAVLQARWVEGPAVRRWWGSVQRRGRREYKVMAWRCTDCGYLESYANDPAK